MNTEQKLLKQTERLKVRDATLILTVAMVTYLYGLNQFRQNKQEQRLGLIHVEQLTE